MPSDFGDESGEKMVDWMLTVSRNVGDSAMLASAEKLKSALKKARAASTVIGETGDGGELEQTSEKANWAKLSMKDFKELPEYESLKEIIGSSLDAAALEHDFYTNKDGHEWLLFKVEDARDVAGVFHELEEQTEAAIDTSLQRRGTTREQVRDAEALEVRAKAAREASRAVNSKHNHEKDIERIEVRSK